MWKVSPETHGVEVSKPYYVIDHPSLMGSSDTVYFDIHVISDDYYVKLVLVSIITCQIVNEIDSNMIN